MIFSLQGHCDAIHFSKPEKQYINAQNIVLYKDKLWAYVGDENSWVCVENISSDKNGYYVNVGSAVFHVWQCPGCGRYNNKKNNTCQTCGYYNNNTD